MFNVQSVAVMFGRAALIVGIIVLMGFNIYPLTNSNEPVKPRLPWTQTTTVSRTLVQQPVQPPVLQPRVKSLVLRLGYQCSGWPQVMRPWLTDADSTKLATTYGFKPLLFGQLKKLPFRVAFLKIPKTGSTTFAGVLYNAANRRRQSVLTHTTIRACNLTEGTDIRPVEEKTELHRDCGPLLTFRLSGKQPLLPRPVDVALNHFQMPKRDAKYVDDPAAIPKWYARQLNGQHKGKGKGLPPIKMMASFRHPMKRLLSYFTYFILKNGKHASFGAWIDSLNNATVPSQVAYVGVTTATELEAWWEATGQDVFWLSQDRMAESMILMQRALGLELFEMASIPTQSGSVFVAKVSAQRNVTAESLLAVTPSQAAKAASLLGLEYVFYARATASFNSRMLEYLKGETPATIQESQRLHTILSKYLQEVCEEGFYELEAGTASPAPAAGSSNTTRYETEYESHSEICYALMRSIHQKQHKQEVQGYGIQNNATVCTEEYQWRAVFDRLATRWPTTTTTGRGG